MIRTDIIATVGRECLVSNIENDEFSYPKAFRAASLTFVPIQNDAGRTYEKLDIRFVKDNISVLIETKDFTTRSQNTIFPAIFHSWVQLNDATALPSTIRWRTLISEWCEEYGITAPAVMYRMKKKGMNFEEALTSPKSPGSKNRKK